MRSIEYARAQGREAREAVGASCSDLFARLVAHLENVYGVSLVPMRAAQMNGSSAEIDAEAMVVKYDASLGRDELLMIVAHELGHLVLHRRLLDPAPRSDLLLASAYGDAGPLAIARYSPRTYEEAQATGFALEFVAPSDVVWTTWCDMPNATAAQLATRFGCSAQVIQTQLAHALYAHALYARALYGHALHASALGTALPSASRTDVVYSAAQLAAARFTGAPAIVDAGPGTGKSATVMRRIRFLLDERGARPSDILVLTFRNEAAQELSERIATVLGRDVADAVNVRTFHGFGMEFLHLHGHQRFELLDDDRQVELVNALLGQVRCDGLVDLRAHGATARWTSPI